MVEDGLFKKRFDGQSYQHNFETFDGVEVMLCKESGKGKIKPIVQLDDAFKVLDEARKEFPECPELIFTRQGNFVGYTKELCKWTRRVFDWKAKWFGTTEKSKGQK